MTGPVDRLRAADPAAALGAQPDERAEADLRLLLTEPQRTAAPVPGPERRRIAPILVTAVVAIAVIALTASVLAFVHPRVDAGGTITPTLGASSCHPADVLPFQCGTYRSTYGGTAVTGDLGGPAKDRLSISFTAQQGALLLTARTVNCFAESVLVRYDGTRLVRIGTPAYSGNGCFGRAVDKRSWAYAFLRGPLELNGADGPYFGKGDSSVFFEYVGAAPIGRPQLPRNDLTCVPAHVAPFSCDTYFSTGGSGSVAFLGTNLFRLSFHHINGQLTASFDGRCNSLSVVMQPDGNTVVTDGGGSTLMACGGDPGSQDAAVLHFFAGVLTYRIDGQRVTFRSGTSTAVFSTDIGACLPSPATSPFCGSFSSTSGNGSVAFAGSGSYRLTFAQAGEQMTAVVEGLCGTTTYAVTIGWSTMRLRQRSATSHPCPIDAQTHDTAMAEFLAAPLVYRPRGDDLSLDIAASGPASSVTFTR